MRRNAVVRPGARKTLGQAVMQIVIADVSMSLDNVLAVAGAAQRHFEALVFGLALSVVLMGVASSLIAKLLNRCPLDRLGRPRHDPLCGGAHGL